MGFVRRDFACSGRDDAPIRCGGASIEAIGGEPTRQRTSLGLSRDTTLRAEAQPGRTAVVRDPYARSCGEGRRREASPYPDLWPQRRFIAVPRSGRYSGHDMLTASSSLRDPELPSAVQFFLHCEIPKSTVGRPLVAWNSPQLRKCKGYCRASLSPCSADFRQGLKYSLCDHPKRHPG